VFALQFLNYLNDAHYKGVGFTNVSTSHLFYVIRLAPIVCCRGCFVVLSSLTLLCRL
jgi:hypothetical protein